MLNPPSPDIDTLSAEVIFDISGASPVITLTNTSTGSGLANVSWWFVVKSPSNTPIHTGTETQPDITGTWTTHSISDKWPTPFYQIEWSGAPYTLIMYAKDSDGNIYSVPYTASICRPYGNNEKSKNFYGIASVNLQVKCEQGRLYFSSTTNHSYKGIEGDLVSSILRVIYPIDETQSIPDPFVIDNFSNALVPITYSSKNYQYVTQQVYDYYVGNDTTIRIQYRKVDTFPVYCNIDLFPLVCEYNKLIDDVENGNCTDVAKANKKLLTINSKMALVFTGILQPLTGVDVPTLIQEIEEIGGFACNCCAAPSGIIPDTSSIIDGYSFSVVSQGGDVGGSFNKVGSNIQLLVYDKKYIFDISASTLSETDAFSVIPTTSGDGYTKTYSLNVDLAELANDLATTIAEDPTTYNLWKTLFNIGSATDIIVDGGCIFQSTSTCNYDFTLSGIPASTTYALLSSITVGGIPRATSYAFNLTGLAGLQAYINGLGYGTFTVTDLTGGNIKISTTANPNNLGGFTYKVASTTSVADMSRTCTGYTAITLDEFSAYIVNYLCQLNDSNIVSSMGYEICYIDGTGTKVISTIDTGSSLQTFFSEWTLRGCNTIDYIKSLGAVDCASIKAAFPSNISLPITINDFLLGTKNNGVCSRLDFQDVFRNMLTVGKSNASTQALFCDFVTSCGAGLICSPFSYYEIIVTDYDTVCTEAIGIGYTIS